MANPPEPFAIGAPMPFVSRAQEHPVPQIYCISRTETFADTPTAHIVRKDHYDKRDMPLLAPW